MHSTLLDTPVPASQELHTPAVRQENSVQILMHQFSKAFRYCLTQIIAQGSSLSFISSTIPQYIGNIGEQIIFGSKEQIAADIREKIASSDKPITFIIARNGKLDLCVKPWKRLDEFANITDEETSIKLLLDGLWLNRKFAPGVHIGIIPLQQVQEVKDRKRAVKAQDNAIIENPNLSDVKPGTSYYLVMKRLEEKERLDHQLRPTKYGNGKGMEFLAREIASMHQELERAYRKQTAKNYLGTPEHILAKLDDNTGLFDKALDTLAQRHIAVIAYKEILRIVKRLRTHEALLELLQQRVGDGHIRRCHGDLKITNLWIPETGILPGIKKFPKRLYALDCVDFNEEFCYIDTLSDVAMLAVDMEMHLATVLKKVISSKSETDSSHKPGVSQAKELVSRFLTLYLTKMHEDENAVKPLLEYYMLEKAMVRSFMCILFDKRVQTGRSYLDVALYHAKRLEKYLRPAPSSASVEKVPVK